MIMYILARNQEKRYFFSLSLFFSCFSPEKLKLATALLRRLLCPFEVVAGGPPPCFFFLFRFSVHLCGLLFLFAARVGFGLRSLRFRSGGSWC